MPQDRVPYALPLADESRKGLLDQNHRIDAAINFLRRRWLAIIGCIAAALPLAGLYLYATPATYTGSTTLIMEVQRGLLQESILGGTTTDGAWLESQIGVLKSQNVAAYVVKQLRLADDPNFNGVDPN